MVYSDNKALLYYDELVSNKQSCGRPQKQYYKCTIKKGTVKTNTIEEAIDEYVKDEFESQISSKITEHNTPTHTG
jgi:hypothetical protein